jgi:TonB family protein
VRRWAKLSILLLAMEILSLQVQAQGDAPGSLVQANPPLYPLSAKAAGIEGKVVLKGIMDTDGHLKSLQVLKGPPELRQSAMDAVKHWAYHPYTDHGKPVPTPTTVNVIFTLGNKKQKAKAIAEAQAELAKSVRSTPDSSANPQNQ